MPLTVVADGDCVTNLCGVPVDQIVLTRTAGASSPAHGHAHAEANVLVSR